MKKILFLLSFIMTISAFGFGIDKHESNNKDETMIVKSDVVNDVEFSCDVEINIQNKVVSDVDIGTQNTMSAKSQMTNQEDQFEIINFETEGFMKGVRLINLKTFYRQKNIPKVLIGSSGGNPGN